MDITPLIRLRPQPLREVRFVLDGHLGRLAAYLRMLGFDTWYQNHVDDAVLAEISKDEQRILLTRDQGLLKRSAVTHGYWVRATAPREQLREIMSAFRSTTSGETIHALPELQRPAARRTVRRSEKPTARERRALLC